jgi:hypothetical protein
LKKPTFKISIVPLKTSVVKAQGSRGAGHSITRRLRVDLLTKFASPPRRFPILLCPDQSKHGSLGLFCVCFLTSSDAARSALSRPLLAKLAEAIPRFLSSLIRHGTASPIQPTQHALPAADTGESEDNQRKIRAHQAACTA